jgi:predicted AlkP superfamily pyrophosphatase or phosphodiesterase
MSHNVVLILVDGLNFTTARDCMGHLSALLQAGLGALHCLECELPALSRPLYECILTGVTPAVSGVHCNADSRISRQRGVFHYARAAGLTTAAAAYYWISELYNRTPFDPIRDRHVAEPDLPIQYGHFYFTDHYPDEHLFADAESLRRRIQPHFLLIHSMGVDHAGHLEGADSALYRNSARNTDMLLAQHLSGWLQEGLQVLITADHGMNADKSHNGLLPDERQVPLYVFGQGFSRSMAVDAAQTELCGTICELLGVKHDKPACRALLRNTRSMR